MMLKGTCLLDKKYKLGKDLQNSRMFSLRLMVYPCSGLTAAAQVDDVAGVAMDNCRHTAYPAQEDNDNDDNDDSDNEIITGPIIFATVELAKKWHMHVTKLTVLHIANKCIQNNEQIPMSLQRKSIRWTLLPSSTVSSMSNYSLAPTLDYHHCRLI
jgi:hypothetical protein